MKNRSILCLNSSKGFILIHVLIFYVFFTSAISMIMMQKQLSVEQIYLYKMAELRIKIEKAVIGKIRDRQICDDSEIILFDHHIMITFEDTIKVSICSEICYNMLIDYDHQNDIILSINYE